MSGLPLGSAVLGTKIGRYVALGLITLLAGCSQMQQQMQTPGYYNPSPASSATDAIAQAESPYGSHTIRAPNQIQFGLKASDAAPAQGSSGVPATGTPGTSGESGAFANATSPKDEVPTNSLQEALFPAPQTFFGTIPCFHPEMKCTAQRITLTMAPNGRWRARAAYVDQAQTSGSALADQGCWKVVPQAVPRIVLLNKTGNVRAELALTASNVLRLISINGEGANLVYTLTKQPDLDPIDELNKLAAPKCP